MPSLRVGELEQRVLLSILRLGPDAAGVTIVEELREHDRWPILAPSVYAALRRLEVKRLIRSRLGTARARRGGRAPRCFTLEPAGTAALRELQNAQLVLWRGVRLSGGS
jgi:PadR family transcriptional regulator PadR